MPCPACHSSATFPLLTHAIRRGGSQKIIYACRLCPYRWCPQ